MAGKKDVLKYRATTLLWHTRQERYIEPGEMVNLSHLYDSEIEMLLEMGVIEAAPEEKSVQAEAVDEKPLQER